MNKYVVMSLGSPFYYLSLLKDKAWVRNERGISFLPEAGAQRQRPDINKRTRENDNNRTRENVPSVSPGTVIKMFISSAGFRRSDNRTRRLFFSDHQISTIDRSRLPTLPRSSQCLKDLAQNIPVCHLESPSEASG
jgi:hypothetical protein